MITYSQLGYYGRLGNCKFEIASTIGIAIKNNEEYLFPEYSYNKFLKNPIPTGKIKFSKIHQEPHFHYSEVIVKDCDIRGYYQSYCYFEHCSDLIKHHFTLNEEYEKYLKDKYVDILSKPNCSLHIRRGDYVSKQEFHPVQPISYYEKALDIIGDKNFLIFSDDIKWCKENFIGDRYYFSSECEDILDLFLMSFCDDNIIANSSFSWWGAWLNNNVNKKIIAPNKWFGPNMSDTKTDDLIPKKWILI